jgi:hypothetical protein
VGLVVPEIGDRVSFEGSVWRVEGKTLPALQRIDGAVVPVAESCVVLIPETVPLTGQPVRQIKVAQSRWGEISVLGQ